MSDTSQEDAQEEDIAPYYNKPRDLDGFSTQEYVDRAGEGPIDMMGTTVIANPYLTPLTLGKAMWSVSSVADSLSLADLEPELQAIKGLPAENLFYSILMLNMI
jgi:hypothetical protein